jgi:hypothetical protein
MSEAEQPISLGLNTPPASAPVPSVDDLQFHRAEIVGQPAARLCTACRQPIPGDYYHAAGHVVCLLCAQRIQAGQQNPPASSLARAALFGAGAALAGCAIYATVWLVTGYQIGLIAILVGVMVGKAIRYACGGLGGRPQQILALVFTYFAITSSMIPVVISRQMNKSKTAVSATKTPSPPAASVKRPPVLVSAAVLVVISAASPFIALSRGTGIFYLLMIVIGLRQAWKMTGRREILIMGPYQPSAG